MSNEKTITPANGYLMLFVFFILIAAGVVGLLTTKNPWFIALFFLGLLTLPGFVLVNPNGSRVLLLFGKYITLTANV